MVAFAEGKAHGQAGVDANGRAVSYEKVAAAKVAGDGGGLFVREGARALRGPEGRRRRAGKGTVVVVILLVAEGHAGGLRGGGVDRRRRMLRECRRRRA